jgi:hypothetical protein
MAAYLVTACAYFTACVHAVTSNSKICVYLRHNPLQQLQALAGVLRFQEEFGVPACFKYLLVKACLNLSSAKRQKAC